MRQKLILLISALVLCINASAIEQDADGVYQIATAQDLVDFATLVNGGTTSANAKVTANIDASSVSYTPISNSYNGTFDGDGHEINLNIESTGDKVGLFGEIGSATIMNVIVKGTISGVNYVAGIVGKVNSTSATITNCQNYATLKGNTLYCAGIVAYSGMENTVITGCSNYGTVTGYDYVGGIVGKIERGASATIECCVNEGAVTALRANYAGGIAGSIDAAYGAVDITACANRGTVVASAYKGALVGNVLYKCHFTSCYNETEGIVLFGNLYGSPSFTRCYNITESLKATVFTSEELANGALCYNLNGGSTDVYWRQKIGTDAHPVLSTSSKIVYKSCSETAENPYTNAKGGHNNGFDEYGLCSICNNYDEQDNITVTNGVYQIASANDLVTFATVVNSDNCTKAKAMVTADIDASEVSYTPASSYAGEFDGGGKTITLNINSTSYIKGLFGTVGAATIKNVNVAGTITGKGTVGGIVGQVNADGATITNCCNSASVTG